MPAHKDVTAAVSIPQLPLFRVTLFYGPDTLPTAPARQRCVFNVKKRSWKGGVQIAVDLNESQVSAIRERIGFEPWLKAALAGVPDTERADYERRAADLFIQELCALKLALALDADLRQENGCVEGERFVSDVARSAQAQAEGIKSKIMTDLDLASS